MPRKTVNVNKGKKSTAAKTGKKTDTRKEFLAKELKGLIPKLDSEGLAFLIEQARVHLYNMQVDELNEAAVAANNAGARARSIAGKSATFGSKAAGSRGAGSAKGDNFRINGTESGSSYYLRYRNDDVMFSKDEMIRLVKIASAPASDMEIRERLYNWFDRERKDVFSVLPLTGKADSRLKVLSDMIKATFKLRK